MNLLLKQCNGAFIERVTVPDDATVDDLKRLFYEKFHFYPQRQQWSVDSADGVKLTGNKLSDCGVKDDSSLYFKDLGVQISWRLVFFLEYLGPVIIFPLLYHFPGIFYGEPRFTKSPTQSWAYFMLMFHFIKREIESLFIHRFSKTTMPIRNLFTNCFHYWVLCGFGIGYYVFHPKYSTIVLVCPSEKKVLVALFFLYQFMTLMTHITLRDLRPKGTAVRGIPNKWGFQYVSCANYFWELLIWVVIALFTNTLPSYLFVVFVAIVLLKWATKKHKRYLKEFPNYDKRRKALIPFVY
ncbi:3-oxo-5-alpha-steroid 4-dehydrogenase family protein [Babesia divergens]|uniref:3-oxo-5-alpha-steroid 4-dehydrogenase family protein n=1 Tax=Babesia divergens TaxID=32595 RepID=A0AAD9LDQ1_BABDI|nr:3-oxo-5-alpha-steroid 4-dehydrogenase family protein [Babesia divergens]